MTPNRKKFPLAIAKMRKCFLLLHALLFFSVVGKAQDAEFSQFYANPLYLNPAYAGTTELPKFHINFRDQWPGISHAYVSYSASYDQYFPGINSGIGVLLLGDQAGEGIYSTYSIGAIYAYQINFSDYFAMKVGVHGAWYQRQLDFNKIFFLDQINPVTGFYDPGNNPNPTNESTPYNTSVSYADIGAGVMGFSERVFFGVAARHINQPVESFTADYTSVLPMRLTAHAGVVLGELDPNDGGFALAPNVMYTQQANFRQLNGGSYFRANAIIGGLWYRYNLDYSDAIIILAGAQTGVLRATYSYDITIQDLAGHSGGTHEVAIIINLDDSENNQGRGSLGNALRCPTIF